MNVSGGDWADGRRITLNAPDKKMVILGNFRTDADITISGKFPVDGTWTEEMTNSSFFVSDVNVGITLPPHSFKVFTYGVR